MQTASSASTLEASGPLGWVLELIQQRRAQPEAFRALVVRVVQRLEMPVRERQRWLELLSYTRALVYHDRESSEREGLRELITASVRTDERRREVETMFRSSADILLEQGRHRRVLQDPLPPRARALPRRPLDGSRAPPQLPPVVT